MKIVHSHSIACRLGIGIQYRQQKAAGIGAMVYIYRLKTSLSRSIPVPFLPTSSSRIRSLFHPGHLSFSPVAPEMEVTGDEKQTVHSVWSRGRDIFPDSPLSVEAPSSVRAERGAKRGRASVRMRLFLQLYPRDRDIYVCRHCVAEYPVDTEGSERSSRENCPLRRDLANREFRRVVLSLLRAFVRASGLYDETAASG